MNIRNLKIFYTLAFMIFCSCSNTNISNSKNIKANEGFNTVPENTNFEIGKFYPIYKFFSRDNVYLDSYVTITEKNLTLGIGENYNLSVKHKYSDGVIDKAVNWVSSDNNIVDVDKFGKIIGLKEGKTIIKAISKYKSDSWDEVSIIVDKLKSFTNIPKEIENKGKIYFEETSGILPTGENIFPRLVRASDLKVLPSLLFPENSPDGNKIIGKSGNREPYFILSTDDHVNRASIDRHLIVENNDGTEVIRLTNEIISSPVYYNDVVTWSPDSSKVVCLSNLGEQFLAKEKQLCIININDNTIAQITNDNYKKEMPLYSPVTNKIIFLSERNNQKSLFVINHDGTEQKQLTSNKNIYFPVEDPEMNFKNYINWSPDGKNIAFISKNDGVYNVNIINSDGSNERQSLNIRDIKYFEWSPDSSKLIISCTKKYGEFEQIAYFYIINTNLDIIKKYYSESIDFDNIHWSPDGNKIMFKSYEKDGSSKLHIVDTNSLDEASSTLPYITNNINWSPDGEKFIANIFTEFSPTKIYIVNKNGTERVKISEEVNNDYPQSLPKWFK